ncbi:hypothetical protein ACQ4PT_051450 [Festuca glaucescens]
MAEAILLAVSKIGMVAVNQAVAAVIKKLSRKVANLREFPAKIKRIDKELKMMNDIIQDSGTTHLSNNVFKGWIENVRKLAYHVEDVIEKYSYEALKLNEEGLHMFTPHKDIDRRQSGGCFPELVSDEDLVGIDENRSKLTEWLTTNEKESTVVTVSGMGGLGKTTLVKNVYDREKVNFPDAHAWVVVLQAYNS